MKRKKTQNIYMFHFEILAPLKFGPWIGEQPYTEMLFWQFSNIIIYVKILEKYQINV